MKLAITIVVKTDISTSFGLGTYPIGYLFLVNLLSHHPRKLLNAIGEWETFSCYKFCSRNDPQVELGFIPVDALQFLTDVQ